MNEVMTKELTVVTKQGIVCPAIRASHMPYFYKGRQSKGTVIWQSIDKSASRSSAVYKRTGLLMKLYCKVWR